MTAEWENTLMEIERGNADADAFLSGIVQMTGDLVKAYPFLSDAEAQRFGTGKEEIGKCPRCGSPVYVDVYKRQAQRIATALEIYVHGSLNVFNHRTNVDRCV